MATVTSDVLLLTQAGIKTEFDSAYIAAQENADWKEIASELPTTLPIQNYAWLGRGAVMKKFVDEVEAQSVVESSYTIADSVYKGDMVVERKSIEDDQYGLIMIRARDLGGEPVRHWNELAFTGLANGFGNICYDGFSFFNASHSQGLSGAQSNTTGASLSDPALTIAESSMLSYLDDKGKPLHIRPDTLVVGPALKRIASDLCGSQVVVSPVGSGTAGSGATASTGYQNYFAGRFRIVVNPYLIGANAYNWFLLACNRQIKPIVIQSRQDVPVTLETDMDQPSAKIAEKYNITVRGRYAQAYGLWQTAYGSNATS